MWSRAARLLVCLVCSSLMELGFAKSKYPSSEILGFHLVALIIGRGGSEFFCRIAEGFLRGLRLWELKRGV